MGDLSASIAIGGHIQGAEVFALFRKAFLACTLCVMLDPQPVPGHNPTARCSRLFSHGLPSQGRLPCKPAVGLCVQEAGHRLSSEV